MARATPPSAKAHGAVQRVHADYTPENGPRKLRELAEAGAWCQSARSRTGAGRSSTCGAAASPASAPRCPADDHGRCNVNELGA